MNTYMELLFMEFYINYSQEPTSSSIFNLKLRDFIQRLICDHIFTGRYIWSWCVLLINFQTELWFRQSFIEIIMKRIAIFGATGLTGKHLVAQALAKGHFVRALVRNTNKLKECLAVQQVQEDHPNLEIWLVLKVF